MVSTPGAGRRHLSWSDFKGYLDTGVPINHPIPGTPRVILFTDPLYGRIGIRCPASPTDAIPVSPLENLLIRKVQVHKGRAIEVMIVSPPLFLDAYPVLCTIADRIQLDELAPGRAINETIRKLGHLLRKEDSPSRELEVGLLGEVALVAALIGMLDPASAVTAWRGSDGEEHDFDIAQGDLEVKTTTSEQRAHWISSVTQLVPTGTRPLWLLSMQVTRAGDSGTSLSDLVERVRAAVGNSATADQFEQRLLASGWREAFAETANAKWRLRTQPALFRVSGAFPRLVPDLLSGVGVDMDMVTHVRYRIDLTNRQPDRPNQTLHQALMAVEEKLT
jgi:hypothetical protein